ncbi:MAG: hypothetical protein K9W43_04220 [Candidatus Thorarchaeota archaeon]|nr:hypothetical protein [Candidatus Thorarchaeota archaeon]
MPDYSSRDISKYKTVSELRTQYQCEYRLALKKRLGDRPTQASRQGSRLHAGVKVAPTSASQFKTRAFLFFLIVTVLAALLWLLW